MKLSEIKQNPNNPRIIKDLAFEKLCNSIKDFPKMLELRPIIVDDGRMILGGNMRFKALEHLGFKEIPDSWVKFASQLTEEEKNRFIIADNVNGGDWSLDLLEQDWDKADLEAWGLEAYSFKAFDEDIDNFFEESQAKEKSPKLCPHCGKEL